MKNILATIGAAGLAIAVAVSGASAAEDAETPHYPIKKPREQSWSFAGPFGTYDKGQLQRGLKVYTEVCAACHSLKRVPFRALGELGYTDEQVKSFAAAYEVEDGPNSEGEMFTRPALPTDTFPGPYSNDEEAKLANNGALPPDFSLIAKARAVERGFPKFVFDIFTQYAEGGPDYIYSLLMGYGEEPPANIEILEGLHYNPYFIAGPALAMAQPLYDESVEYDDGTPATLDQQARDVSAFLMWAAEPHLGERKEMGFRVMIFLILFAAFLYVAKRQVWSRVEH
ncbi:cytochrome c1 [Oricola cellulosilytica]|uniref:Cytochrome c1 n=1 Tax=Oricola cellulosilytica TaxID=1429082 RepID=A0A4R0PDF1_9HYPH|nr:cytochrome c1 [Oricola cellulosilytica]TCD15336.1 cytochrome c1 [Oricola cellulosilytica]